MDEKKMLLATCILLEEPAKEALGENWDMVLVIPEGLKGGVPETMMTRYQIKRKVEPPNKNKNMSVRRVRLRKVRGRKSEGGEKQSQHQIHSRSGETSCLGPY
jgi:hypothetical protein